MTDEEFEEKFKEFLGEENYSEKSYALLGYLSFINTLAFLVLVAILVMICVK